MKKQFTFLCTWLAFVLQAQAQENTPYPIDTYGEPRVGTTADAAEWDTLPDGLQASWASRDELYQLHRVPQLTRTTQATLHGWKGERTNLMAVLYSKTDQGTLTLRFTPWKKDGAPTPITAGTARFVNYVITDDYKACGNHPSALTPWLSPDVIDGPTRAVPAWETRPVWCSIGIPRDAEAGQYTTTLEMVDAGRQVVGRLHLTIHVNSRSLPTADRQRFHLDLWQQPYAVSRYYGVERWSEAHIQALRPYLQALGRAGQRVVSAILFHEPWGEQTHDKFSPMVRSTRKADGTWAYDYSIFDRYVELCAEYGIDRQINCYSMVPWDMTFRYYDEAQGKDVDLTTTTDSPEYRDLWNSFLAAFKEHLIRKGWFGKTCIAMDERGEEAMLNAHAIASAHGFKMALAGNYHATLNDKLADFCVALNQVQRFTPAERQFRKDAGLLTTIYTSCADAEPNIYTNSLPAEAAYLPLHVAANGLDGYLHWSWINWDEHPLTDSRFRMFASGDTYCYYPGNRSSVRFERLVEGIHQYEKIQILKEEYKNDAAKLNTLNTLLAACQPYAVAGADCAAKVNKLENFLNGVMADESQAPSPRQ